MKKILILGTGNAQVDAIKLCKEKGYKVHACSYTSEDKGNLFVDYFALIDITNVNAVLEYAKNNSIDIVYSTGSDVAMPTALYVSEELKLPYFVSAETAIICNTKQRLRAFIGDEGYNVKFLEVDSKFCEINLPYPLMMKPVDSQGQRGIRLIHSRDEFVNHFDVALKYSKSKKIILEEYVDGPEISANVYVIDGEIIFSIISDRISWPQFDGGIIHRHVLPTKSIDEKKINSYNKIIKKVIEKLNINNGPAYFQIKLHKDQPKLIEVTPRLDGCHLWRLIKESTGVDLLDITLTHLIENKVDKASFCFSDIQKEFTLEFICKKPNSIVEPADYNVKDALYIERYYKSNEIVKEINGYMEKIGYFISSR